MLFNSFEFPVFLVVVFSVYWFVIQHSRHLQNLFILGASYFFYGWWDWRFLILIFASSLLDFLVGQAMSRTRKTSSRFLWLGVSLTVNLGLLGFFKYFNFFVDSFVDAFGAVGIPVEGWTLDVILPVGISFYTFQTLSYTLDIYRGHLEPTKDVVAFFAFVAFFPQLVAGPIERASNLLPQFRRPRRFDYVQARDGLRQILWGLFKKVVIADTCAVHVDAIFGNHAELYGSILVLGAVYFAFQIYGDFSGYSDIAIGTAQLFGFRLTRNFAYPYFSRDIAEFWRRWHISLSSWFRDYVYIPLGGSRGGRVSAMRNVLTIFALSGFWHGASWTFVAWGFINALYFMPLMLLGKNRTNLGIVAEHRRLPGVREAFQMASTFGLVLAAWVLFRSESLSASQTFLTHAFSWDLLTIPDRTGCIPLVGLLVVWEWIQRTKRHGLDLDGLPVWVRWSIYLLLIQMVLFYAGGEQEFIYFQF